jgi:osmoprotectant transport system substrate-binding protein
MQPALEQGQADLAPEYLGSSLTCLRGAAPGVARKPSTVHEQLEIAFGRRGVDVLDFAPAQDKNAIVVTKATSERYGLDSISDLPAVASALSFGGPPECATRPLCLEGLEDVYGIRFKSFVTLDASGPLTLGALKRGEVDVALFFSTHPALSDRDLVVLRDDEKLQPPENIVPVIRSSVVRAYGDGLSEVINAVTERITTSVLRRLNEEVDVLGEEAPEVAQQWLEDEANIP